MSFKQSLSWWCYAGLDIPAPLLMRHLAEIGYDGVELLPPQHFALAKEHGLAIVAINGHSSIEEGLNKRENFAAIETAVRQQLSLAQEWHIPNLIVFSGNRHGQDDETGLALTVEHLQRLAPLAEAAGVTLILELLNSKVDHPNYMCDKSAWGTAVCQQVNSPRVKLLYDIYHMQIMEGNIIQTIQEIHPYVGHYHTAGVPGRAEIDASQELNYAAIFQAIIETGYTDYVGHEFVPRREPITALQQAYQLGKG